MNDRRDVRAEADAILGNTTPTPSAADLRAANRAKTADAARAAANGARAAGRKVSELYAVEAAVQNGQPDFPHTGHQILTIFTVGLWAPIYWAKWMFSKRRRYQRARRAELKRHGLG